MSIQTATNRLIVSPLQAARAGLYQLVIRPAVSFQELGNRLIQYAEYAQAFRQVERVQEAGQLLTNLPLRDFQAIGQYYLAWCDYRNNVEARETLEHVAEYAPMIYRARALQSLAAIEALRQDYASELNWLVESLNVYPSAEALRGIAIVKAKEGDSRRALEDLESLLPLARASQPVVLYSWLNSLATELGEAGRKQEARNISQTVLASPFIHAYAEWQETAQGLKEPNRSFVAIDPSKFKRRNVLRMPVVQHANGEGAGYNEPARITNLQQWKKKMGKEPEEPEMTEQEAIYRIIHIYTQPEISVAQRYKMLNAIEKIAAMPDTPEPEPDNTEGA